MKKMICANLLLSAVYLSPVCAEETYSVNGFVTTTAYGPRDFVTVNQTSSTVSVVKSKGNGVYSNSQTLDTVESKEDSWTGNITKEKGDPSHLAHGDIDNDGDIDILVSNSAKATVSVLKNDGSGSFSLFYEYPMLDSQFKAAFKDEPNYDQKTGPIRLADMDGDGDLDLLFVLHQYGGPSAQYDEVDGKLALYWNLGNGSFTDSGSTLAEYEITDFIVADFYMDGRPDVMVNCKACEQIYPIKNKKTLNNGQLQFGTPVNDGIFFFGNELAAGDIDGDQDIDIVAIDKENNQLIIGRNQSHNDGLALWLSSDLQETVDFVNLYKDFPSQYMPTDVALGDLDNDGDLDVVISFSDLNIVHVLANDGSGQFSFTTGANVIHPGAIALEDINHDGFLDIVVTDDENNKLRLVELEGITNKGGLNIKGASSLSVGEKPVAITAAFLTTNHGAGLNGVTVSIGNKTAVTDASGFFSITGLSSGEYTASAAKSGYSIASSQDTFSIDSHSIQGIEFTAASSWRGGNTRVNNRSTSTELNQQDLTRDLIKQDWVR